MLGTGGYGWVRVGECQVAAHRLIWIAAEGDIPPGIEVNHANKLRWDNGRANLELTTHGENMRHRSGQHYLTVSQALRELAELPPAEEDPWRDLMRAPGGLPADVPPGMMPAGATARGLLSLGH